MNTRKNKTTGFVPSCRPPVPSHNQKQIESCVSSECLLCNTKAERKKPMEPADIIKITMTVDEAKAQLAQLPDNCKLRSAPDDFMIRTLIEKPTPAQAEAALVLAWNAILSRSELSFRS